eukprot:scaffold25428_cov72-Skeletonema_dohrnii-CCMP3373.AAC.2
MSWVLANINIMVLESKREEVNYPRYFVLIPKYNVSESESESRNSAWQQLPSLLSLEDRGVAARQSTTLT